MSGKDPGKAGAYFLYDAILLVAALPLLVWLQFRRLLPGHRSITVLPRLGGGPSLSSDGRPILLLHGVSVGEIRAMRSLVGLLQEEKPAIRLVIASATPTGMGEAARLFPELDRTYFPLDLGFACRNFLDNVGPSGVVLMELEIWPNFLRACQRRGIPVAIVNGRITERSMRGYRRVQRILPQFDRIAFYGAQNERYAARFRTLPVPVDGVEVTGNLKYDNLEMESDPASDPLSPLVLPGDKVFVLGSTHEPEEWAILSRAFADSRLDEAIWVVVPRHPRRGQALAEELAALAPDRTVLLKSACRQPVQLNPGSVVVVDSIGELETLYGISRAAFVGGSLIDHGGQNVLEPAARGVPQVVGPSVENFAEEADLLETGGGLVRAEDAGDLLESFAFWLENPKEAREAGNKARNTLKSLRGASRLTLNALIREGILPPTP